MRKALIPAAGRGIRMRPFSRVVPKELAPLGARPAIDWVVREAVEAGLDQIAVVVAPRKPLIAEYLRWMMDEGQLPPIELELIIQEEPKGLAEAIALCRRFVSNEPFALLLPDNLFLSSEYSLTALVEVAEETGCDVRGLVEVDSEDARLFGNTGLVELSELGSGLFRIDRLVDGRPGRLVLDPGETILRACGRYICQPQVFDVIDELRASVTTEYSEVPVYQRIIDTKGLFGCVLPGPLFDVGHPAGLLAANHFLAELEIARVKD